MRGKWRAQRADRGAHAARGFVGGAASWGASPTIMTSCFNAARGFVGGAATSITRHIPNGVGFQCRTRLCGWCNSARECGDCKCRKVSMPHAAIPFRPHHRFAVPLPRSRRGGFSFTARRLLFPMRRTKTAAKLRRNVKGYGILASPADAGEVASAASR